MLSQENIPLSEFAIFFASCLGIMLSFYLMERILQKVLELMKYTDIHDHTLAKGHYTRQVNLICTFITGTLAISSLREHGLAQKNATCEFIRSYELDSQYLTVLMFLSYLAYDAVFHKLSIEHYIHHSLGFFSVSAIFFSGSNYGAYFISIGLLIELSTVPMNLIFVTSGKTKDILMGMFVITFFIVRPIFMFSMLSKMVECKPQTNVEWFGFGAFIALYLLNLYWFILLCRKVWRKFFGTKHD